MFISFSHWLATLFLRRPFALIAAWIQWGTVFKTSSVGTFVSVQSCGGSPVHLRNFQWSLDSIENGKCCLMLLTTLKI